MYVHSALILHSLLQIDHNCCHTLMYVCNDGVCFTINMTELCFFVFALLWILISDWFLFNVMIFLLIRLIMFRCSGDRVFWLPWVLIVILFGQKLQGSFRVLRIKMEMDLSYKVLYSHILFALVFYCMEKYWILDARVDVIILFLIGYSFVYRL